MDLGYIHCYGALLFQWIRDYSARCDEALTPVQDHIGT